MCSTRLWLFRKGLVVATPRDDYSVSQITTSAGHLGSMIRLLFIAHFRTCGKLLRRTLTKSLTGLDLGKVYGEHRLSSRIMSAVASGMWSTQRKGVSISLTSTNHDAIALRTLVRTADVKFCRHNQQSVGRSSVCGS